MGHTSMSAAECQKTVQTKASYQLHVTSRLDSLAIVVFWFSTGEIKGGNEGDVHPDLSGRSRYQMGDKFRSNALDS